MVGGRKTRFLQPLSLEGVACGDTVLQRERLSLDETWQPIFCAATQLHTRPPDSCSYGQ